jgi:beta-lactamase class A
MNWNRFQELYNKHPIAYTILIGIIAGNIFIGKFFLIDAAASLKWTITHHEYPYLDPSTSFVNRKDLIVNVQPLRDEANAISAAVGPNKASIYIEVLNTGTNISINKDLKVFPASLAKLPLAIVILKKVEDQELRLSDSVVLDASDLDDRSGTLYKSIPGTSFTIGQLVDYLLIDSDNTAQRALLKRITPSNMQDLISETGLEDLANPQGQISAKEYTRFLRLLYFSSYLEQTDSQLLLKLLTQASFKDFLSTGVPAEVSFAHKYGTQDEDKIYSDAGIVFLKNRPYMITVMLQGVDYDTAKNVMEQISSDTYRYMSQYNH